MLKEQTSSPPGIVPNLLPHDINTPSTIDLSSASASTSTPPTNAAQSSSPDSISHATIPLTHPSQHFPTSHDFIDTTTDAYTSGVSLTPVTMVDSTSMPQTAYISSSPTSHYAPRYDMLWSSWPRDLPSYNLLRHLCVLPTYPSIQTRADPRIESTFSLRFTLMPVDSFINPLSWLLYRFPQATQISLALLYCMEYAP